MKRNNIKKAAYCAALLTAVACSGDDEPQICRLTAVTENPTIYLYIEDADGRDLIAAGETVAAITGDTGLPLPYNVCPADTLPWGGRGALLAVTPPEPYHAPFDDPYVYTLTPHARISIGGAHDIVLQRVFDYDLHRREVGHGKVDVDVRYRPTVTLLEGAPIEGDTAHIIIDHGFPYLRVEGEELTLTMLLPKGTETLAALPLKHDAGESLWRLGDELQVRLLFSGMSIARPYETVAVGTYHDPGGEKTLHSVSGLKVEVSLRLPCIYSMGSGSLQNYSFHYLMSCPAVFGDDGEHSVELELYSYGDGVPHLTDMHVDYIWCDPIGSDPNNILIDWRNYPNY